ncbi:MAG: sigma-70 family RNA polymerase sigma factor [bacterium]|nr:sigma-70 family RNA polymerase sigma factor [bacterium]
MIFGRNERVDTLLEHTDFVYKCAYRYSGNKLDAEDLTQETFYAAYKKLSQLKDMDKCKSWLFAILRNTYLRSIEKNKNVNVISSEDFLQNLADESETDNFNDFADCNLQEALNTLPEKYKTPVLLYYFSNISYKEMAAMLEIPIGTVMSRIARAKIYLRKFMKEHAENNSDNVINYKFKKEIS